MNRRPHAKVLFVVSSVPYPLFWILDSTVAYRPHTIMARTARASPSGSTPTSLPAKETIATPAMETRNPA